MKAKQNISIDEDLLARLKEMAVKEGRSLSNLIEFLLRKAVEDK